jgi:hypothetical protein
VRSRIDSGSPRPRALGLVHAIEAVPGVQLGDGGAREEGRFEERDVQGFIPRTSLEVRCIFDPRARDGEDWLVIDICID